MELVDIKKIKFKWDLTKLFQRRVLEKKDERWPMQVVLLQS